MLPIYRQFSYPINQHLWANVRRVNLWQGRGPTSGPRNWVRSDEELGFYRGCKDVWNSAIRVDPNFISAQIQRTIKQMDDLLQKYPISEHENKSVSDMMDSLRLKFRAICASLNVKLEYNGYPKASDTGKIEF
ncbi:hypothetical protein DH2020_049048 [Rehmannia glutinosa]|uniref:Uncharacterized protein n=1 Tax=Rehmannia glutinosa TaxID=99300 RepID=A0ABR0U3W9_REHGL